MVLKVARSTAPIAAAVIGDEQLLAVRRQRRSLAALAVAREIDRHHRPAVRQEAEHHAVLAVADEHLAIGRRHVARMKGAGAGRDAGLDASALVEGDQRPALARLDRRHAWRAVGGNPQALAALVPGDRERMQGRGQRRQRPAGLARHARIWRSRMLDTQIVVPSLATPSTRRCFGSIVSTVCGAVAAATSAASRISEPLRRPASAAWSGSSPTRRHIRAVRRSDRRRDNR